MSNISFIPNALERFGLGLTPLDSRFCGNDGESAAFSGVIPAKAGIQKIYV